MPTRPTLIVLLAAVVLSGCQTAAGPDTLVIDAGDYARAFDAAVAAAKDAGMPPEVRDRRGGVIETVAVDAPTLLEPWRVDGSVLERRLEQTISHERRRARFEFMPIGDALPPADPPEPLLGPDLLATRTDSIDRTSHAGTMALRVWVYTERSHQPGLRRDTWTRRASSTAIVFDAEGDRRPRQFWTPVARDPDLERRLLARVERALPAASAP
ncbi:MAG: hypothetical protein HKO59_12805 [Phycisphaerales bacterium]|nr:hypothetical protein [Phycisphaerae bacterium]NNF42581.1 hypothetical protein [Phycisphaerales bacterium]NNM26843.1 hypothetical protein [Phycisphaerales bacterium]